MIALDEKQCSKLARILIKPCTLQDRPLQVGGRFVSFIERALCALVNLSFHSIICPGICLNAKSYFVKNLMPVLALCCPSFFN